jgi:Na+/phosphate symporter
VAPSEHTSALQSIIAWLDQRRAWQFALIAACAAAAASTVAVIITQQLVRGHLNLSAALGTAIGTMIGTFTVALGVRLTRPPQH